MARIKIVVSAHIFLENQLHIEKKVSVISFRGHPSKTCNRYFAFFSLLLSELGSFFFGGSDEKDKTKTEESAEEV